MSASFDSAVEHAGKEVGGEPSAIPKQPTDLPAVMAVSPDRQPAAAILAGSGAAPAGA